MLLLLLLLCWIGLEMMGSEGLARQEV